MEVSQFDLKTNRLYVRMYSVERDTLQEKTECPWAHALTARIEKFNFLSSHKKINDL